MPSPYVSRLRLAREVRRLREEHEYSADQLANQIGISRQRVSVVENAREGVSPRFINLVCDHLSVGRRRREVLLALAEDTRAKGWWEPHTRQMGPRQARVADLECGASKIAEYSISLIPGLLQTAEYSEARVQADPSATTDGFDPAHALEARAERQRRLAKHGGSTYDAVIDEVAIRRHATPADVMRRQLKYILELVRANPRITVRMLPIEAHIVGQAVPRSAFSIYFHCPADPVVVNVDTLTQDLILVSERDVSQYLSGYERLRAAALTPQRTAALLHELSEGTLLQEAETP